MRVAVMGSGGVGGYYGGKLAAAGEDVTFVARGAHLAAIQRDGLQVKSVAGDFHVRPKATDEPATIGPVDLVLFSVKGYDTEAAAEKTRPLVGPETVVLSVQNGVDNEEKLARVLGKPHVLGGVVHVLSTISSPGVISQIAGPRTLKCGEMDGGLSPRVARIVEAFTHAGVGAEASPNILVDLWEKFVFICAHGGVTALGRFGIGDILGCAETAQFYRSRDGRDRRGWPGEGRRATCGYGGACHHFCSESSNRRCGRRWPTTSSEETAWKWTRSWAPWCDTAPRSACRPHSTLRSTHACFPITAAPWPRGRAAPADGLEGVAADFADYTD